MTGIAIAVGAVLISAIWSHAYHSYLKTCRERINNDAAARLHESGMAATLGKKLDEMSKDLEKHKARMETFIANVRMK